ncbi:hypothetical protein IFM89_010145 [Coptis chinensis]|uniref:Uncharacterized protein n=1 Tax=Coptis chinensis TaxID=261450 RepID=A0A835LZ60_9MAGN|nr:hypothetical protein IFM89_010145 [Coptis chinensis]
MTNIYSSELQGVMEIVKEVFKLPRRNKKIFLFIILSTMILDSLLFLATITSFKYLSNDLLMKVLPFVSMDPKSSVYLKLLFKIKEDAILLILVEMVFLLLMTVVSLFSMVATIYVSAMSYLGKSLTLTDLCFGIKKIWTRPVITWLYISLCIAGFTLLILPLCFVLILGRGSMIVVAVGILVFLPVIFLNLYLSLVWMLSLVMSVLEDCYGLQALGKAEKLVKGRKVVGLVLTFLVMILYIPGILFSMINKNQQTVTTQILIAYGVTVNFTILVKILSMMAYTVFYFELKESHGEQVVVEEDMEYRPAWATDFMRVVRPSCHRTLTLSRRKLKSWSLDFGQEDRGTQVFVFKGLSYKFLEFVMGTLSEKDKGKPRFVILDVGMTSKTSSTKAFTLMQLIMAVGRRDGRIAAEETLKLSKKRESLYRDAFIEVM